jgi:hypothetical protein
MLKELVFRWVLRERTSMTYVDEAMLRVIGHMIMKIIDQDMEFERPGFKSYALYGLRHHIPQHLPVHL